MLELFRIMDWVKESFVCWSEILFYVELTVVAVILIRALMKAFDMFT